MPSIVSNATAFCEAAKQKLYAVAGNASASKPDDGRSAGWHNHLYSLDTAGWRFTHVSK